MCTCIDLRVYYLHVRIVILKGSKHRVWSTILLFIPLRLVCNHCALALSRNSLETLSKLSPSLSLAAISRNNLPCVVGVSFFPSCISLSFLFFSLLLLCCMLQLSRTLSICVHALAPATQLYITPLPSSLSLDDTAITVSTQLKDSFGSSVSGDFIVENRCSFR